jgi:NADH-quinone oxidoreductase subunit K
MTTLQACLLFSSLLFGIGLAGVLARSSAILVLLGVELMLNAAAMNFIAFWRFNAGPPEVSGLVFVLFAIAIAAAEAAVGLSLVIALYRHQRNIRVPDADRLRG